MAELGLPFPGPAAPHTTAGTARGDARTWRVLTWLR